MQKINPNVFNETLARITKSPTLSAGVLEDAVKMIAEEGCKALNTHRVGVWKLSEDAATLKSVIYYDASTGKHSVHEDFNLANRPAYFELLKSERLIVVNDTSVPHPLSDYTDNTNMCAVLDAPIRIGGELAGLVCIEQDRCEAFPEKRNWTVAEQKFVSSLADFAIIAIESAKRQTLMRRTEMMMSNLPGMVFQCRNDPPIFTTTYVSEGCKALTGYTPDEYISGTVFRDMVHPDDMEPLIKHCAEMFSKGLPMEITYRIITKDGNEKWVCEHSRVIETYQDGTPCLIEGFFTDITESRQLATVEKERERVKTMLNATPLVCNVWNRNHRVIDCNEEALRLFEMDKKELMDKFLELAPEFQPNGRRTSDYARNMLDKAFKEGKCVFEWINRKLDGTLIPMEVTLTRVAYGDDYAVVSYARDLRQHQQMMMDIAYRDYLLNSVNQAATLLLAADNNEDIETPIMASLEIICRAVSADRVSIWRNEIRDGDLYHICDYTWNAEEQQNSQIATGQIIFSDKGRADWKNRFMRGECVGGPISKMSKSDREFLGPFGMKSVIIIPLFIHEQFWGLFSVANRELERDFSEDEINILRSVSLMMASAVNRHSLIEKINEAKERSMLMLDTSPLCAQIWDKNLNTIDCNEAGVKLYGFKDKQEYKERFLECCSPEYQPDGQRSDEKAVALVGKAFEEGFCSFDWMHQMPDGTPIPAEVTLVRAKYEDDDVVLGYTRDLREHNKMMVAIENRDNTLRSVNQAAVLLLAVDSNEDIETPIMASLEIVCRAVDATRISIWRNEITDGYLNHICTYSWINNTENRAITNPVGFTILQEQYGSNWEGKFARGECVSGPVSKMSQEEQDTLKPLGTKSIAIIPLFVQNQFWGLFSVSYYDQERDFSEDEISILRSVSLMMASVINRHSLVTKIHEVNERARILLEMTPLGCGFLEKNNTALFDCNPAMFKIFELVDKQGLVAQFRQLSPKYQPDGKLSADRFVENEKIVLEKGYHRFEWMHQKLDGTPIPCEVTLIRVSRGEDYVIAAFVHDLREHKEMMAAIESRNNLLQTVNQVATLLLAADNSNNIESSVIASMEIIGRAVGANRTHIWQNEMVDGSLHHVLAYSWCCEIEPPQVSMSPGLSISQGRYRPEWQNRFKCHEYISGPLSKMSQSEQEFLSPFGMKSVIIIPLFIRDQFWGLFSIDDCVHERDFSEEEINILRSVSLMMASAVHRHSLIADVAEAQERTSILFDTTPLGCSLWDEEFNQTNPNMEMVHLFGLRDKQEYLDRFFELSPEYQPDGSRSSEFALENLRKAFREGYCRFEHWHQQLDGTPIPTEVSLIRISTNEGYIVAGYIRDLREHKKMMEEIREADERARLMLDTTPMGCAFLKEDNTSLIDCNPAMLKIFGATDKQDFIAHFLELSPEYQPCGQTTAEKFAENRAAVLEKGCHHFEWMHTGLDGTPIPCEITLALVTQGREHLIAAFVRDLREHKKMMAEIDRQNHLLETVNQVSTILLDPSTRKFEDSLFEAMGMMAKAVDVDRAYIWKNHTKDGRLYCTQLHEWSETAKPQQGNEYTVDISYETRIPNWETTLSQGKCINNLVRDMSPSEQAQLSPQDILSIIAVPIFLNDQFWGFVGFDDCRKERVFTENEELILRSASRMIANALIRNEMAQEMRTTAMQLENVISNYPGIIWCVDKTGLINLFNGVRLKQLGFCSADMVGKNIKDVPLNFAHSEIVDYVEKTFREGAQDWITKTDKAAYHMHTTPIYGADGSVTGIVGSADDITEIARLQERLATAVREANAANMKMDSTLRTMESIMNNMDMFIYVTDPRTGKIFFVNDEMKKAFGIEGDDGIGRYCYELFRGVDAVCEFCPCHQLNEEPDKTIIWEEYEVNLQRHIHHFDCYIDWPTGEKAHLQYAYDITELVVARELAKQSARSKSDFLAKMSHEIRTPMNAIIGMTELALREDLPDAARAHAMTIKQAGANLLAIINDVLDFSKIESGNLQIAPVHYLLSSLMNDVVSIIRMRAIDSHIRFTVYLDSTLPNALIGDETRIRQVLINLLGNAVKYTDKGYVSLMVHGEMTDASTINLIMEVKDSGRGIRQEDIGKLFLNFAQLDIEANRGIEGVGLGLAISQSVVTAMNGEITVESEFGKGSTFTVTLPQKIFHPEKLAIVDNPEEKSAIVYERRETYADSILYAINNLGVKYEQASSDEQFCAMLKKGSFPFIFVSHALLERNKDAILQFNGEAQVVLLAEFGETLPVGNWSVLSMPAHAISIANIFNGESEKFAYNANEELTVRFIARDAKVLVVDDIHTNLKVTNGLLQPYEMVVDLCDNGADAIKAVQSKNYDIVFMDHWMPEMDGMEAMKHIRALDDDDSYYKDLPIVALTANAVSGMQEIFLQSGFDDFLSKPIDTVRLNAILKKWIPKEKQANSGTDSVLIKTKAVYTHAPPLVAIAAEGLDTKKGVRLSGGTVEYYYETLATFQEDGLERKKEIRRCLDAGNLSLYAIHVHALKGAAANIGADQLSEVAYGLEMAGRRGDLDFIKSNNDHFLMMLEQLLSSIEDTLSSLNTDSDKADSFDTEQFRTELAQLESALANMDLEAINHIVDRLLALARPEHINTVRNISKHILLFEYEEANALIESLLQHC